MSDPLVTVVTPIYQGAAHVAACVESVLAQEYEHWIHLLVDNRSTDGTAAAVAPFVERDPRVRLVRCDQHVGMLANWNRALALVPDEAVYVRQLNVDDRLQPRCLARSVAAAEAHPGVAIVSSYFQNGDERLPRVEHDEPRRLDGREVVRRLFLGGGDYLAQPSVLLLRRAALAGWPALYDERPFPPALASQPPLCQADKEGFLATLAEHDLLFLPEELVHLRVDADSATGYSWRVGAWHAGWLELLLRHGERFLRAEDVARAVRRATFKYLRSSAWRSLKGKTLFDREYADFHRHALRHLVPALTARGFRREARALGLLARLLGTRGAGPAAAELSGLGAPRPPR